MVEDAGRSTGLFQMGESLTFHGLPSGLPVDMHAETPKKVAILFWNRDNCDWLTECW